MTNPFAFLMTSDQILDRLAEIDEESMMLDPMDDEQFAQLEALREEMEELEDALCEIELDILDKAYAENEAIFRIVWQD